MQCADSARHRQVAVSIFHHIQQAIAQVGEIDNFIEIGIWLEIELITDLVGGHTDDMAARRSSALADRFHDAQVAAAHHRITFERQSTRDALSRLISGVVRAGLRTAVDCDCRHRDQPRFIFRLWISIAEPVTIGNAQVNVGPAFVAQLAPGASPKIPGKLIACSLRYTTCRTQGIRRRHDGQKQLTLLVLVMLLLPLGLAHADSMDNSKHCGDLSDADCQIILENMAVMDNVFSLAFLADMTLDVSGDGVGDDLSIAGQAGGALSMDEETSRNSQP